MESKRCECGKWFNVVNDEPKRCKQCSIGHPPAKVRKADREERGSAKGLISGYGQALRPQDDHEPYK